MLKAFLSALYANTDRRPLIDKSPATLIALTQADALEYVSSVISHKVLSHSKNALFRSGVKIAQAEVLKAAYKLRESSRPIGVHQPSSSIDNDANMVLYTGYNEAHEIQRLKQVIDQCRVALEANTSRLAFSEVIGGQEIWLMPIKDAEPAAEQISAPKHMLYEALQAINSLDSIEPEITENRKTFHV